MLNLYGLLPLLVIKTIEYYKEHTPKRIGVFYLVLNILYTEAGCGKVGENGVEVLHKIYI